MSKITDYQELTAPLSDDVLVIVDTHDLSMSPYGTTKQVKVINLLNTGAILGNNNTWSGSNTFNGEVTVNTPVNPGDAANKAYVDAHAGGGSVTSVTAADASVVIGGTSTSPTIRTNTLDQIVSVHAPAANWSNNNNKITNLANGTASSDAAAFGQIPSVYRPWQFSPDDPAYGAKGDGRIINDATILIGNLSQLTSASANFTSADTGKHIMLNGGQGNNAQPLITTITFVNSTTITLASPATGAISGASAVYGTDDTTAIQNCITAAGTYAMASGGTFHAQIVFSNKIYCLATLPPVTTGIAGSTTCQLRVPSPASSGVTQKLILDFIGVGAADANMYWESTVPSIQGTCLVSMCIPPFTSGTNPYPSVLGYQYASDGSLVGGFANTKVYVDGITVAIPFLGPQGAYDFRFLGGAGGGKFSAMSFGAPVNGTYNNLVNLNNLSGQQNGSSIALYMPLTGNNDDCQVVSFASQGFTFGTNITEHCAFHRLSSVYDLVGIQCVGGGAHGNWIGYASVEAAFAAVQYTGTNPFPLVIDILDTETVTTWHIQDTQNSLFGYVMVHTNSGSPPAVLGGINMKIIYDVLGPGVWSGAPSAPANNIAQKNSAYREATVYLSATTGITAVSVDSTALGLIAGNNVVIPVRVPPGHTYTVTYTGTLTTKWILE